MSEFNTLNTIYKTLNQKRDEILHHLQFLGFKCKHGYYSEHSIRMNNEWVTEQYPIPVITVNQLGDIGIDLEHYFLELILTRSQALDFDFDTLSSYQFEVYGMEDYLNDFYNINIPLESIHSNILKSKEHQIGVSIFFNKDEDLSVLSHTIMEISKCIVTESKLKSEYINAPCKTSSLPYWKTKVHSLPDHMKVVIEIDYNQELFHEYLDEPYFKLIHRLENIKEEPDNKQYSIQIVNGISELDSVVAFINKCYQHISVTLGQAKRWMQEAVYDEFLWIWIIDERGKKIAMGIADYDSEIGEGILEWIQVLPEYRGQGVGRFLVKQLLLRLKGKAQFVTVSGELYNKTNPRALYLRCGFGEEEIWHVLRKQ